MSEIEYNFEAWKARVRQHELAADTVSLTKQGYLAISHVLFEKHFSLEFSGAEIFVDTNLKAIALKPSNDKALMFLFKPWGTSKNKILSVRKLMVLNNIEPRQYTAKWSEKYKMLIFTFSVLQEVKG